MPPRYRARRRPTPVIGSGKRRRHDARRSASVRAGRPCAFLVPSFGRRRPQSRSAVAAAASSATALAAAVTATTVTTPVYGRPGDRPFASRRATPDGTRLSRTRVVCVVFSNFFFFISYSSVSRSSGRRPRAVAVSRSSRGGCC